MSSYLVACLATRLAILLTMALLSVGAGPDAVGTSVDWGSSAPRKYIISLSTVLITLLKGGCVLAVIKLSSLMLFMPMFLACCRNASKSMVALAPAVLL